MCVRDQNDKVLTETLRTYGCRLTTSRTDAEFFVADDPTDIGGRASWCASPGARTHLNATRMALGPDSRRKGSWLVSSELPPHSAVAYRRRGPWPMGA